MRCAWRDPGNAGRGSRTRQRHQSWRGRSVRRRPAVASALNRTKYTGPCPSVPGRVPDGPLGVHPRTRRLAGMRIVTAAEAVAGIESGQQIYLQCAAATPSVLLDALVARASDLRDVSVVHLHCEGPGPHLAPEMAGHFRHRALFIGPNARAAVNEGRADYVPVFLSDVPRLFESGALPLDVVFVNATPPDAHGFCSLGTSVEAM